MSSRPLEFLATICSVTGLFLGPTAAIAQAHLLTDLGAGYAAGINNSGHVVLNSGIYINGTLTTFPAGFTGNAINASDMVVGSVANIYNSIDVAVYDNGTVTDIAGSPPPLADPYLYSSAALGINADGLIVGWETIEVSNAGPFLDTYGIIVQSNGVGVGGINGFSGACMQPFSFCSQANAINEAARVTGVAFNQIFSAIDGYELRNDAFIYDSGTLTDLGPGEGFAINATDQVTGVLAIGIQSQNFSVYPPIVGHAFLYSNGTMSDLGTLPGGTTSTGYAINVTGQVVGASDLAGRPGTHAFFYNGAMQDMNALVSARDPLQPFVTLTDAHGINDSRLIVVNGIDSRTKLQHAYLLQGPWLDVAPGPLFFPSQTIGTVSSAQAVSLTNSGSTVMALSAISITGNFNQTNDCGATLAPSGKCTAMVTFAPKAAGNLTGALTVIAAGVPITVPLSGTTPIQVNISSSAATTTAGVPVKLTWTASPGASCMATGGSAADGWTGIVKASGTQSVTETTAGTYQYGLSCTAGSQSLSKQTSVVVTWPVVSVSLTALPASFAANQSVTLKWSSVNATSCTATGGGTGDAWAGAKAASGSVTLMEPDTATTPIWTLAFTLKCTSSASGRSASANAKVIEYAAASGNSSGGGGGLEPMSVLFLAGVAGLRYRRQKHAGVPLRDRPPSARSIPLRLCRVEWRLWSSFRTRRSGRSPNSA